MIEFFKRSEHLPPFYTWPKDGESDVFTKTPIPIDQLPAAARDTENEGRPPDHLKIFLVPGEMGLATYVVLKTWNNEGKPPSQRAYAIDIVGGKRVGDTSFNVFSGDLSSTHMGTTEKGFERRGLGERRIIVLNEIVEDEWKMTLVTASNVSASSQGEGIWRKLVERKLATVESVNGTTRYQFIPAEVRTKSV